MIKDKSYFQSSPTGSQYTLFNTGNKPDKTAFGDLFDSIPFKTNLIDTASETAQGLIKLSTDANAILRLKPTVGQMAIGALVHQLPMLIVTGSTEIAAGANASNGIKITGVTITDAPRTRLSYKIEFDPDTLATSASISASDYLVADIGGVPKKILIGNAMAGAGAWQRVTTTISPVNAGDILDMGIGAAYAGHLYLNTYPSSSVQPIDKAENTGAILKVAAGNATAVSNSHVGGQLYLIGGLGCNGGIAGDVGINFDGNTARGKLGIGGAADTTYQVKITGGLWITGSLKLDSGTPSVHP